jgi:hypothetical protein
MHDRRPCQTGFRFARNAAVASRKSSVAVKSRTARSSSGVIGSSLRSLLSAALWSRADSVLPAADRPSRLLLHWKQRHARY